MFQIQNHHHKKNTCYSAVIALMLLFFAAIFSLLLTCTELGREHTWNNPLDPGGSAYFPPAITVSTDTAKISYPGRVFSATATAIDSNDTIVEFVWTQFNGWIKRDTGITSTFSDTFNISDTGINRMYVYARDRYGLVSKIDTLQIVVRPFITSIRPVNDMIVKQDSLIKVKLSGTVNEGSLTFLYDPDNSGTYSSILPDTTIILSKPEGGLQYVHWAIRDEYGTVRYDTFTVYFNKAPFPPAVISPEDTIKKLFNYDYEKATGSVRLEFSARDTDDTKLTYQLQYYRLNDDTFHIDNHHDSIFQIDNISPSSLYFWRITVRDSSGNVSQSPGHFFTTGAPAPPAGMKLIKSKGRTFYMGQQGYDSSSIPLHTVTFTNNFWIDSTEVTCKKFVEVLSLSNFSIPTPKTPVTSITWFDAVMYCNALSKRDSLDTCYSYTSMIGTAGNHCQLVNIVSDSNACGYRLPTEAQWEYACRGGTSALFFWGNDRMILSQYAWTSANSGSVVHEVASLKANPFGLYDISGNVWEWCNDWYDRNYYRISVKNDPTGPQTGTERVVRGGASTSHYYFSQSGTRSSLRPDQYNQFTGFRAVLIIK